MSHHSLDFIKENISAVHMKQWWEAESITGSRGIVSCALTQILGSVYLKENFLPQAQERLAEVEKDRQDLLHLQSLHKLTWIPDKVSFLSSFCVFNIASKALIPAICSCMILPQSSAYFLI
jgi:hypothetical protein